MLLISAWSSLQLACKETRNDIGLLVDYFVFLYQSEQIDAVRSVSWLRWSFSLKNRLVFCFEFNLKISEDVLPPCAAILASSQYVLKKVELTLLLRSCPDLVRNQSPNYVALWLCNIRSTKMASQTFCSGLVKIVCGKKIGLLWLFLRGICQRGPVKHWANLVSTALKYTCPRKCLTWWLLAAANMINLLISARYNISFFEAKNLPGRHQWEAVKANRSMQE